MVEVTASQAAIIACLDTAGVLDGMPTKSGAFPARVAPEELLLIGPAAAAADLLAHAVTFLERAGSAGLAIDVSDAWSVCTVAGADAGEVWARLSENRLPDARPAFVQGAIASIPAKTIAGDGEIHMLTPSNLGHHVPHQVFAQCRDLAPQAGIPRPFALHCAAAAASVAESPALARVAS